MYLSMFQNISAGTEWNIKRFQRFKNILIADTTTKNDGHPFPTHNQGLFLPKTDAL